MVSENTENEKIDQSIDFRDEVKKKFLQSLETEKFDREYVKAVQIGNDAESQKTIRQYQLNISLQKIIQRIGKMVTVWKFIDYLNTQSINIFSMFG